MTEARAGRCRWHANGVPCDALVYWLSHERTGVVAPIDMHPVPDGNIVADLEASTYRVLGTPQEREAAQQQGHDLRKNHWATCPAKADDRARRAARPRPSRL